MAIVVAQRIVNNIANYQFTMDGEDVRMAISGGMSEYPTHSEQIKDLIEYADQAMYDTKQNGGNGVMIYQKNDSSEHQAYEV
jgi:diguanylate cyclase (GGDEF)-like protein